MSHKDSMLWLLEHHIQAALTLIFINMKHGVIDEETANYFLLQKAKDAEKKAKKRAAVLEARRAEVE